MERQYRKYVYSHVAVVISELKLSLSSINGRVDKNDMLTLTIGVNVGDISQIDTLMKKLQQLPPVRNVYRSTSV